MGLGRMRDWEESIIEARSRCTGSCSANANYARFTRWDEGRADLVRAELEERMTRDATRKRRRWVKGLGGPLSPTGLTLCRAGCGSLERAELTFGIRYPRVS